MLEEAFKNRTAYRKPYGEDYVALQRDRLTISNVLRSLAVNMPDQYLDMRRAIRTWTTRDETGWNLHFGVATSRMIGRRPGFSTTTSGWIGNETNPTLPDQYAHTEIISDVDSFQRFAGKVLELPPATNQATAEFADVLENLEPFEAMFGDHWNIEAVGPTTLQLTRK